jgi:hypothetical protein
MNPDTNVQAILLDDGSLDTVIGIVKDNRIIKEYRFTIDDVPDNEKIKYCKELAIKAYLDEYEDLTQNIHLRT